MACRVDIEAIASSELAWETLPANDFGLFVQLMFAEVYPGRKLEWNSALSMLCAKLQGVVEGKLDRVIINLPPRSLKSFIVSAALTAFQLGHDPSQDVMCVSYGQDLANDQAKLTREIMQTTLYKSIFGPVLASGRQKVNELRTRGNGVRRATSIDGSATGHGADLLIFDDPQKAGEILSEQVRKSTNNAYEQVFYSRANDPKKKRIVVVMQRLHEDDFVGHVMALGEDWEIISLPAIAEEEQTIHYDTIFGPKVYRRKAGESLHTRYTLEHWAEVRRISGEARWATQYQQRPAPAGGGVVKIEWFKRFNLDNSPVFERKIQSWDTANKDKADSAYSVCTTWGVVGDKAYLLDVFRARLEFPALRRQVINQAQIHGADTVLIEEAGSGIQLIQQLRAESFGQVRAILPQGSKLAQMEAQSVRVENGQVYVPNEAPWLAEYLHEFALFDIRSPSKASPQ